MNAGGNSNDLYTTVLLNNRGIKLVSLNINSLTKHIDELRVFLDNNSVDLLSLCETKLDASITDNEPCVLTEIDTEVVFVST